jgi:hypothetical protein
MEVYSISTVNPIENFPPFLRQPAEIIVELLLWSGGKIYLDRAGWRKVLARGLNRATAQRTLDELHTAGVVFVRRIGDESAMVTLLNRPSEPEAPPAQVMPEPSRPRFTLVRRGGAR